jgi:hypothetical protein
VLLHVNCSKEEHISDADIHGVISGALGSFIEVLVMLMQRQFYSMYAIRD